MLGRPTAPLLCAAAIAAAFALAGCGQSDRDKVEQTVRSFRKATDDRDYTRICKDILAQDLVARLDQLGVPCETALERYLAETRKPRVTVQRVQVKGKNATASITSSAQGQPESRDEVKLVQEDGGWRIASLGGG